MKVISDATGKKNAKIKQVFVYFEINQNFHINDVVALCDLLKLNRIYLARASG